MPVRSLASALFRGKCPRCREGDMFVHPFGRLSGFNKMNASCPHCGVHFEPEPGFYQGAMFVSYAISVALIAAVSIVLYFSGNPSEWVYIGVTIAVITLMIPFNYRYSRILYLYLFGGIKFDASRS